MEAFSGRSMVASTCHSPPCHRRQINKLRQRCSKLGANVAQSGRGKPVSSELNIDQCKDITRIGVVSNRKSAICAHAPLL